MTTTRKLQATHERAVKRVAGLKWGVYGRLSDDKTGGSDSVDGQITKGRDYVDRRGGTVAKEYRENDTSAYHKRRVPQTDANGREYFGYRVIRPVWHEALADLREGRIDALAVYDLDRLGRDHRDLEDAIEVVEHHGREVADVADFLDLRTDGGRMAARMVMASNVKASADTSRRVRDWHVRRSEKGLAATARAYGWKADKLTLDPTESAVLREAARLVLEGKPVAAIVAQMNAQGHRTTAGNEWRPKTLTGLLTNPRLCGYVARNFVDDVGGRVVRTLVVIEGPDGEPLLGQWEPLVDVATWAALCEVLRVRNPRPGSNASKYLLTGIGRCGKCGVPMRAFKQYRKTADPTYAYQCPGRVWGGCGGVSMLGPDVDRLVVEAVLAKYEAEAAGHQQGAPAPWPGAAKLEAVQRKLTKASDQWAADTMPDDVYFPMVKKLSGEKTDLMQDRAAYLTELAKASAAPIDLRADWPTIHLSGRRAYITDRIDAVVIRPRDNPAGFTIVWKA